MNLTLSKVLPPTIMKVLVVADCRSVYDSLTEGDGHLSLPEVLSCACDNAAYESVHYENKQNSAEKGHGDKWKTPPCLHVFSTSLYVLVVPFYFLPAILTYHKMRQPTT